MAGQLVEEVDRAGHLVAGQVAAGEGQDVGLELGRGLEPIQQLDGGLDRLTPLVVGDAEHGGIGHRLVLDQHLLDLGRVDVDPTRDDHVGGPVGQEHPPVFVHPADVADGVGAGLEEGRLGLLRGVVVLEHLGAELVVAPQGARLPRGQPLALGIGREHLVAGHGPAHRAGVGQPVRRADHGDHTPFAGPPVLDQHRSPPLDHALLDRHRHRGRPVQDRPQRRRVEVVADLVGQAQQAHEHGGHQVRVAHPA